MSPKNFQIISARTRGITLLELLVVITLMAILGALVYPSFGTAISTLRLKGAARQLVSACRSAKWEAISKKKPYRLLVDLGKARVIVSDPSETVTREVDLPAGITITQAQKISEGQPSDASELLFFPNGTAEAGSILLRDSHGKELKVVVDYLTADARIEEVATVN